MWSSVDGPTDGPCRTVKRLGPEKGANCAGNRDDRGKAVAGKRWRELGGSAQEGCSVAGGRREGGYVHRARPPAFRVRMRPRVRSPEMPSIPQPETSAPSNPSNPSIPRTPSNPQQSRKPRKSYGMQVPRSMLGIPISRMPGARNWSQQRFATLDHQHPAGLGTK